MKKIIRDNDIYFIQVIGDKIVVNNNYKGIYIYDYKMNLIKEIQLFENICIYSSFITGNNKLILFCPENEKIAYIDMEKDEVYILIIPSKLNNSIIDKIVLDTQEKCIFATTKYEYLSFDKITKCLEEIEINNLAEKDLMINQNFKEDGILDDILIMYNDCNNIDMKDGNIAITYESKILLLKKEIIKEYEPAKGYIFNNSKILKNQKDMYLVVLSNSIRDNKVSIISTIRLD